MAACRAKAASSATFDERPVPRAASLSFSATATLTWPNTGSSMRISSGAAPKLMNTPASSPPPWAVRCTRRRWATSLPACSRAWRTVRVSSSRRARSRPVIRSRMASARSFGGEGASRSRVERAVAARVSCASERRRISASSAPRSPSPLASLLRTSRWAWASSAARAWSCRASSPSRSSMVMHCLRAISCSRSEDSSKSGSSMAFRRGLDLAPRPLVLARRRARVGPGQRALVGVAQPPDVDGQLDQRGHLAREGRGVADQVEQLDLRLAPQHVQRPGDLEDGLVELAAQKVRDDDLLGPHGALGEALEVDEEVAAGAALGQLEDGLLVRREAVEPAGLVELDQLPHVPRPPGYRAARAPGDRSGRR